VPGQSVAVRVFPDEPQREALFVADEIKRLQAHDPDASIAVLGRSRAAITPISEALVQAEVDIIGSDLTPYSERSAVADLMSLTRWLANPADKIAFIALLRTPMIGVTLRDIGHLAPLLDNTSVPELIDAIGSGSVGLSDDGCQRLLYALNTLAWAESKRDRLDLTLWIEQTWVKLGGKRAYPVGEMRDVSALLDEIRRQELSLNRLDITPLIDWFERGYSKAESATARVELMTLHKSKGLEFDHVFIVGAAKTGRSNDSPLLRWYRDGNKGLMIAAKSESNQSDSVYDYLGFLNKAQERQELTRLFYVGVTRAKLSCTITATQKSDKAWPPSKTTSFWSTFCDAAKETVYEPVAEPHQYETEGADTSVMMLRRLQDLPSESKGLGQASAFAARECNLTSSNLSSRRYGIALHRGIELLCHYSATPKVCPIDILSAVRFQLVNAGVPARELEDQLLNMEKDLNTLLLDETGRWLISSEQVDAHSELSLWDRETQRELIIDRTFIDRSSGVRWIVDYKSSQPHQDEPIADFTERESRKYQSQLEKYRDLMASYDESKGHNVSTMRMALYFPRVSALAEVGV
jgi:ATP-dependent exoDNAse (exonuclease V) beta subunit